MSNYPKGSEWRLWDLHIHTPASYNFKRGGFAGMNSTDRSAAIKQVIKNINESDVSVYAINDYWTFDGYLALRAAHDDGEIIQKTLFPGIELRIESATRHRINIHVILSDKLPIQKLKDFKATLKVRIINSCLSDDALREFALELDPAKANKHGAGEGDDYKNDPEKLFQIGAQTAEITKESFVKALEMIPADKRLVMIPYDCYGGVESIDWKTQMAEDLYFLRLGDLFEERLQDNIDLFTGRKTPANEGFIKNFQSSIGGRPKPCVSGSDGHSIEGFKTWQKKTNTKKTWIKADPTFEGLRQIVFEPTARVRVQETNPGLSYTKPFVSMVSIKHEMSPFPVNLNYENPRFSEQPGLSLNSDLVCVIGGRGTGKSCLVDYLGKAFGLASKETPYVLSENFEVVFNKDLISTAIHNAKQGDELPFVYISQNEVKAKITTGTVGDEIKQMLGVQDLSFDSNVDGKTRDIRSAVDKHKVWFKQTNEKGEFTHDQLSVESQIARNRSLLESITTLQNKNKLERFTANISKIAGLQEKTRRLNMLKEELNEFKLKFDTKVNAIDTSIPLLNISQQIDSLLTLVAQIETDISECEQDNICIRADFAQVYTGDLSGLLQNAESYKSNIEKLNVRLEDIIDVKKQLNSAVAKQKTIPRLIARELHRQKKMIDAKWKVIQAGHPDWTQEQMELMRRILSDREISLEGCIIFDVKIFIAKLKDVLNLRSFRATNELSTDNRIQDQFKITNLWSFLRFMKHRLHKIEDEGFVSGDLAGLFYDVGQRSSFLRVEPVITYGGRPLERLSVGQKGTVYLCLKLATQAFTQPLIFDQPEDDLDNEFIIEELVDIFRGIKQFRQVILVTHNANLVVNADADQVVVAENNHGVLKYISGSLENPEINHAVRRILEGGDEAFRKRDLRYNLK